MILIKLIHIHVKYLLLLNIVSRDFTLEIALENYTMFTIFQTIADDQE